jgi:glucosamine--fructose-6-phosphate aminotransferase (isomerizing)
MNLKISPYNQFSLIHEMYDAVRIIREFDPMNLKSVFEDIKIDTKLFLTGEGSSRIFPAKNIRHRQLALGKGPLIFSEGCTQMLDYQLGEYIVIGASNSGKTKEVIQLFTILVSNNHPNLLAITCNKNTPLQQLARQTIIIENCLEKAVAATKSVIAQALVYEGVLINTIPYDLQFEDLAIKFQRVLDISLNREIVNTLAKADTVFFAGNNNGVAEELSLKTNEILRKKSVFLPGTFLLHGIEEVITKNDVLILVDPLKSECDKIEEVYARKIGAKIISFENHENPFLIFPLPNHTIFEDSYLKMAAGWNMLAETGIIMGIDIDKPLRARKIGNEFGIAS